MIPMKLGAVNTLSAGVQTDISSLELDDSMPDAFTLQQINTELVREYLMLEYMRDDSDTRISFGP